MRIIYTSLAFLFIALVPMTSEGQVDKYGGWLSVEADPKDYFYVSKINGRYTLITPEGHAYYPLGMNHMSVFNANTYAHVKSFQNQRDALNKLSNDIRYFGMNCGGGGSCPDILKDQFPFFVSINLTSNAHWLPASRFKFQDVFEQDFMDDLKVKIIGTCVENKNNPFLIGYYWTDTPRWDVELSRQRHLKDWVTFIRNQNADAAGKQQYIAFLENKYETIDAFNEAYALDFQSFESMLDGRFDHIDFHQDHVVTDDTEFLGVIANHLYKLATETILEYDPNHLILGEKYIAGDHPEPVLKAAAKYVDVISIQPGPEKGPGPGQGLEESVFNASGFDMLYELTGKPLLICDHTVSFYTKEHPVTLWHQFENQQKAGEALEKYITECANKAYIVGYLHCQYLDAYDHRRGLLKQGLLNMEGERHEPLSGIIRAANLNALSLVRSGLIKGGRTLTPTAYARYALHSKGKSRATPRQHSSTVIKN